MASGLPPQPVYPQAIDNDYTLFLVNNTTETVLTTDNDAWSSEIEICPVPPDRPEIWADNGFANIEGELIYYDAVEKTAPSNSDQARVTKLKRCARNLGGKQTKFNPAGTWIRSFVVAELHNQITAAILKIEDFVGVNFDTRVETLDYRIRNLRETPVIFDDFSCPDITFFFDVIQNDPASGILTQFEIQINGTYNSFRLDFGDGSFTTTDLSGTHRYALNSQIDPVVTVSNSQCQIVQSPVSRDNPAAPQPAETSPIFKIDIPEVIDISPISVPSIDQPKIEINIPPVLLPCIDITPFPGISIGPIDIQVPSHIDIPSRIEMPSVISFTPVNLPTVISITPVDIPSVVSITPVDMPSIISFGPAPSIAPVEIDVNVNVNTADIPSCIPICDAPSVIAVDWGSPPTLNVAFVQNVSSQSARRRQMSKEELELQQELGDEFKEFFDDNDQDTFQVEYSSVGIPHEITILPPEFPDINVVHNLPGEIVIKAPEIGPIKFEGIERIPHKIEVINVGVPTSITVTSDIPSIVRVESNIPHKIEIVGLEKIPSTIFLDASSIPETIKVVGVPDSIELKAPDSIKLVLDEDIEVPLVYRGAPIELKLDMPKAWTESGEGGEHPCVMIVPCPRS